ncbi:unnamed protein product [Heterobilharzia americana]|nr:unnamed protein product [Heterobilharzia americana]
MATINSEIPHRRRANSAEPKTSYLVQKFSKLVLNGSNSQTVMHPKDSSVKRKPSLHQSKFFNPFARLASFSKRRKTAKIKVPPLNFSQSYAELILELAYTSNLTRQVIRPFNRYHLVNQLTECARLIRGRIASGAACIQFPSSNDTENSNQRLVDNRMIMDKIDQFNEAHALFTDWINKLSSAEFVNNLFGPTIIHTTDETNHIYQQILPSESSYTVQDSNLLQDLQNDGELLFCQLQSCALSVFELLKTVGYTSFIEPSRMEASLYECCYSQNESYPFGCKKNDHDKQISDTEVQTNHSSYNSNIAVSTTRTSNVFTTEDRELLAKLWRYLDPTSNVFGNISPPPKPPLPNSCPLNLSFSDRRTEITNSSTNHSSTPLSLNPFDDPDLVAYLCTIASTAQQKYPTELSPRKCDSTSKGESLLLTSGLDLNATEHLSFPLVDESDPSDTESTIHHRNNSTEFKNFHRKQLPDTTIRDSLHPTITNFKLHNGYRDEKIHQNDKSSFNSTHFNPSNCNGKFFDQNTANRKIPYQPEKCCKYWSRSMSTSEANNPLSDSLMQEQVAKMVMHLQDSDLHTQQLENPLITSTPSTSSWITGKATTFTTNFNPTDENRSITHGLVCHEPITESINDNQSPICHSEVKSDTEDVYEVIEANGKKYRRYFQRRVVIERHKVSEVILAPSLPDGTGPDLSRVIISRSDQMNTKSINDSDHTEYPNESDPSLNTSNGSPSNRLIISSYPISQLNPDCVDTLSVEASEMKDPLDYVDSDGSNLAVIDAEPPKPPLPNEKPLVNYMFRFGSSDCDNPDDERRLSNQLIDFFRDQWLKEESAAGPHERKKIISYIQRYTQPTASGNVIHRATCIQHTCTVRMVGGVQGLKAQASRNAGMKLLDTLSDDEVSDRISCSSLNSSSNEIVTTSLSGKAITAHQLELSSDLSSCGGPESQITITSGETDDEEIQEDVIPTETVEKEIYLPSQVVATTTGLPILSLLKANEYLIWSDRNTVNDISVHAGCIDALTVYMTSYGRMSPSYYLFFETFLFMYRSFMTSEELVDRLITRYQYFMTVVSRLKQDLNNELLQVLENFEKTLSKDGYDSLSRILHITILRQTQEKLQIYSTPSTELINHSHNHRSDSPLSHGRASSLCDIPLPDSMLNESYTDNQSPGYDEDVGFITLPKVKSKRSQVIESVDRYSLVESIENDHSNSPIMHSFTSKRIMLNSSKNGLGLLNFSAKALAEQFTYLECLNYYKIEVTELLDISKLERGKAPGVAACARHFTAVSNWATYQLLYLSNASDRDKIANRLLDVMEHLYKLQNFSTYLSLLCAFLLVPDALFSRKTRSRLSRITPYMQPPYFSKYRRDLEAANPPLIPYLGLMLQNLVVLAQGNPLYYKTPPTQLADRYQLCHGPIINFWRCWKHFLIIHFFVKQEKMDPEKSRYSIRPDEDILRFFNDFENSLPEAELRRLANRLRRSMT